MTLSEELKWRGFVYQNTYKNSSQIDKPVNLYLGVDPSAPSMTIGNLSTVMMVKAFIKHNHNAYMLVGGATGLIGDPDGKKAERELKTLKEIANNETNILAQYKGILRSEEKTKKVKFVNNIDWFKDIKFIKFLRNYGKHVPMRHMLSRDFVQTRLKEGGAGISYAEFSYSLMQAYDFWELFKKHNVTLQVCGSDQWGNCIAGVELIRRIEGKEANIWSHPLVINKTTGKKFGKTEEGAIWLDAKLTSVYKFYQFWLNVDDEGTEDYLKIYTELNKEEIENVINKFKKDRSSRLAQKTLAYEVTKIVHGEDNAKKQQHITEVLFSNAKYEGLTEAEITNIWEEFGQHSAKSGDTPTDVLVQTGLASSKTEAKRFLDSNAVYINNSQISLSKGTLASDDTIHGFTVLRRGKNTQIIIRII